MSGRDPEMRSRGDVPAGSGSSRATLLLIDDSPQNLLVLGALLQPFDQVQADTFFITKPVGKGTELWLSHAWNNVEHHGGHINVVSEPGRGSTFSVTLPISQENTADKASDDA